MGYNTEATVWPAHPVPTAVMALIDRFFNLLDSHGLDVGNTLAEEIFTSDAEAQFGAHTFKGKHVHLSQAEIRKSRDNAWKLFETRKHTVSRVYSSNNEADDLLFIAWVAMDLKNGENVAGEFVGRLQMADTQSQIPRIRSYSIWGDSAPLVKALGEN